jgi:hypothetical protein
MNSAYSAPHARCLTHPRLGRSALLSSVTHLLRLSPMTGIGTSQPPFRLPSGRSVPLLSGGRTMAIGFILVAAAIYLLSEWAIWSA